MCLRKWHKAHAHDRAGHTQRTGKNIVRSCVYTDKLHTGLMRTGAESAATRGGGTLPTISASRPVASRATRTIFGHRPALAVPLALLLTLVLAAGCGQTSMRVELGKSASHTTATPTTVVTPTPTTPPQSAWHIVPGLENDYDATLAPSDPRIAYRLTLGSCGSGCPAPYTLNESDDDGAHWSPRTVPSALTQYQSGARAFVFLYVSPLQPQVLLLASIARIPPPACPSAATASVQQTVQSGSLSHFVAQTTVCRIHFYSADGGHTWRQITLPAPGVLIATPQARGTTLYATVSELLGGYYPYIPKPSVRLVRVTMAARPGRRETERWSVPGKLSSLGALCPLPRFCSRRPTYASVTRARGTLALGRRWRALAATARGALRKIFSGSPLACWREIESSCSTVGAEVGAALTPQIFASTDGGNHWSAMPSMGIDIAYPVPGGAGGVLADGSLLESFSANTNVVAQPACAFYAWAPGQSQVQPIGAQLSGECGLLSCSCPLVRSGPVRCGSSITPQYTRQQRDGMAAAGGRVRPPDLDAGL